MPALPTILRSRNASTMPDCQKAQILAALCQHLLDFAHIETPVIATIYACSSQCSFSGEQCKLPVLANTCQSLCGHLISKPIPKVIPSTVKLVWKETLGPSSILKVCEGVGGQMGGGVRYLIIKGWGRGTGASRRVLPPYTHQSGPCTHLRKHPQCTHQSGRCTLCTPLESNKIHTGVNLKAPQHQHLGAQ